MRLALALVLVAVALAAAGGAAHVLSPAAAALFAH